MTTIARSLPAAAVRPHWSRSDVQIGFLLVASLATSAAVVAVSLFFPAAGEGGWFTYASVKPISDFTWAFLTLTGVNLVLAVVTATIVSVLLAPGRGWRFVTVGAILAMVGVALYAVGVGGWAMLYGFATSSPALDEATATAFIEAVNADALRLFGPTYAGVIALALAGVLVSVGLWRARSVPRWLPALMAIGAVLPLILPTSGVVGAFVETPQALGTVLAAWYLWRRRPSLGDARSDAGRVGFAVVDPAVQV